MKVLMLGWEYPPEISGGLATACQGLAQGLIKSGHKITFIIPKTNIELNTEQFRLINASNVILTNHFDNINFSQLNNIIPNIDSKQFLNIKVDKYKFSGAYGPNLLEEVYWFAVVVAKLASELEFDIIHAHDWLTYLAGIMAKEVSKKPLVVHVHATEFDRSANINKQIYAIERLGMFTADKVMTVSNLTQNTVINKYGIPSKKIITTYNGVEHKDLVPASYSRSFKDKIVTFLGRITYQKGPQYFIEAAEKVLKKDKNVRFVMAGTGDLMPEMIKKVADKRLSSHFHFTGFLKGEDVNHMLAISDVFVMPSVSEPFGITPLEAMRWNVPVIISRQSGVAEVLPYALKVDYWDTDSLADAIHGLLSYKALANTIKNHNKEALENLTWENAASNVSSVYSTVA